MRKPLLKVFSLGEAQLPKSFGLDRCDSVSSLINRIQFSLLKNRDNDPFTTFEYF